MPESPIDRARAALARGDVLVAYDEALTAVEAEPDDIDARFVGALALARAGARERARAAAADVLARVQRTRDVPVTLREDAAALVARLAKDDALGTSGPERHEKLLYAAQLYEAVSLDHGGSYPAVNAATLYLLAGDSARAHDAARRARAVVESSRGSQPDYWLEATAAEASLVLGDLDGARAALAHAASIAGEDHAALAITRRQLLLVCDAVGVGPELLHALEPPWVLHYCGHLIDTEDGPPRFPASIEPEIVDAVRDYLDERNVAFGYGSLACGSDIVIAEALLDHGARLEVVLPFASEEFDRVSVAPAGGEWSARFWRCLERASSVVLASDSSYMSDDELFGYAGRIAMGHALNHAAVLDAPVEQLAVWDEADGGGIAGTAHDVAAWRGAGKSTRVIRLHATRVGTAAPRPHHDNGTRRIGAILFTDLHGFSRLRDEHFPVFVNDVLVPLGNELDRFADKVLWRNSWGDAIAAVFADVTTAAECALSLHDALEGIDLVGLGLPADLKLRIGAHVGPVIAMTDPIGHRLTFWGRELTRAARIEPRTPEGEVYVTDSFAALLALEPSAPFGCEYVGRITTAKEFETIPMYRLARRPARAGDAAA